MRSNSLIISITTVVMVLVICFGIYLNNIEKEEALQNFREHKSQVAQVTAAKLENFLRDRSFSLSFISRTHFLPFKEKALTAEFIQSYYIQNKHRFAEQVTLYGSSGDVIYSTDPNTSACDSSLSSWAKNIKNKGKVYFNVPLQQLVIATPLYKYEGNNLRFAGIFSITMNFKKILDDILNVPKNLNEGKINPWLIDNEGKLISSSEHPGLDFNYVNKNFSTCYNCHQGMDFIPRILKTRNGSISYAVKDSPEKLALFVPVNFRNFSWILVLNIPVPEETSFLKEMYFLGIMIFGFIVTLFVLGASLLIKKNTKKVLTREYSIREKERISFEKKIAQSEKYYRTIVQSANDIIIVFDHKGIITFVNRRGEETFGVSAEELIGRRISKYILPGDLTEANDSFKRVLQGQADHINIRVWSRDKRIIFLSINSVPMYDEMDIEYVISIARDITMQRQSEEALYESENRYRSLVEVFPDAVLVHSSGEIVYINPAGLKMVGVNSPDQIIGKDVMDIVHPDSQQNVRERMDESRMNIKRVHITEGKLQKFDGSSIDVAVTALPFLFSHRPAAQVIIRDITERKQIEEALKESEAQFRHLADESPNVIYIIAQDKVLYANRNVKEILGYSREELYAPGFNFLSVVSPEFHNTVKDAIARLYNGEQTPAREYKLINKNGGTIDAYLKTKLISYKNEKALMGIITDITPIKKAEEQLRESENLYHTIFDQSPDGVTLMDINGHFLQANNKACNMLGYSSEEFSRLNIADISLSAINRFHEFAHKVLQKGNSVFEAKLKKKNGEILDIGVNAQVITLGGKIFFHSIWEDITEKRKIENELRDYRLHLEELVKSRTAELDNANMLLQQEIEKQKIYELKLKEALESEKELSTLKSTFISTASHEFRTPLTVIMASADLLEMCKCEGYDEKLSKHIRKIQGAVNVMTELLDEVLTINRAESGKMTCEPRETDLKTLCSEILDHHKNSAGNEFNLILQCTDSAECVNLDPKIVTGILNNLVSNAIKYSPDGGNIILKVSVSPGHVRFDVEDEGIGINSDEFPHLFEPFYRGKNVKHIKGSGLGLSIVEKAALIHGGSVKVKKGKRKGSVFTVFLKTSIES